MAEQTTTLELTRLFCRSLNPFNFFRKPSLYATVSLISDTGRRVSDQHHRTDTDRVGGCNPDWCSSSFTLHVTKEASFVKFEVFCHGRVILPDRKVGEVQVPLMTLVDEFNGTDRFQEHRVKGHGNNAALHFSYRVINGGRRIGNGVAAAVSKASYFDSTGTQFTAESIVVGPARQVQRCRSGYVCRGGSTVAAEIGGGEIKEEDVSGRQRQSGSISGLQLTGYGCQFNRFGGSLYGTRLL